MIGGGFCRLVRRGSEPPREGIGKQRSSSHPITCLAVGLLFISLCLAPASARARDPSPSPGAGFDWHQLLANQSLPEILTGSTSSLAQGSVTLRGFVNPEGGAAVSACEFDYVDGASFEAAGYAGEQVAPCQPPPPYLAATEVSADLSGLQAGTTYDYRLLSAGAEGGSDSFTTPPAMAGAESETQVKVHLHHGPLQCSRKACSRGLDGSARLQSWVSPRFPPGYGWLFSVYRKGHSLQNTNGAGGCEGTSPAGE